MRKQYGVVLIGCGYIGEEHLADIHYRDNVKMIAVVDTDISRAELLAKKYGVPEYDVNYQKYIEREETDIVVIATYVDTHLAIMRDCIAAGCHVLCEKPAAISKEAGEAFFREAKDAETQVMLGHELRYNGSYRKIAEMIHGGVIGKLKLIRMVQNHHALNWERYQRLMQDCPPVVDCGVHYLDVMRWMSGEEIEYVTAVGCYLDADAPGPNYSTVQLQMSGGCMGFYESGWSRNLRAANAKEFIGEQGYIRLTLKADRESNREEGDLIEVYHSGTGRYEIINNPAKYKDMYAQLSELIRRIEGGEPEGILLDDARAAFMAAQEAKEKIENCQGSFPV